MFRYLTLALAGLAFMMPSSHSMATEIETMAPDFTATDVSGKDFTLSDHKGKVVVLEWSNHQCPYVIKHYDTGNMQKVQKAAHDKGVEWVTIVSSAKGKQGHTSDADAAKITTASGATISSKIMDPSGEIGKLYGARTTPHMFVIDTEGMLAYAGAIDDNSSPRHDTVEGAHNYLLAAINEITAGKNVTTSSTQPYGCSVKYNH